MSRHTKFMVSQGYELIQCERGLVEYMNWKTEISIIIREEGVVISKVDKNGEVDVAVLPGPILEVIYKMWKDINSIAQKVYGGNTK